MRPPVVLDPETFLRFGFFVRRNFLTADHCRRLRRALGAAGAVAGAIWKRGRQVRSSTRRVDVLTVSDARRARVDRALDRLRPRLAEAFGRRLHGHEPLQFLRYGPGGRYGLHTDRTPGTRDPALRRRRVSIVVFLSPERGCRGGELVFPSRHGLPLAVRPEPGLLIAFRPDLEHAVLPVRSGRRFSIATWMI